MVRRLFCSLMVWPAPGEIRQFPAYARVRPIGCRQEDTCCCAACRSVWKRRREGQQRLSMQLSCVLKLCPVDSRRDADSKGPGIEGN